MPPDLPRDASQMYRWLFLCFDAGVAYARGEECLTPFETDDSGVVEIVRADWRLRMEGSRPAWLTACIAEQHEPPPWEDTP